MLNLLVDSGLPMLNLVVDSGPTSHSFCTIPCNWEDFFQRGELLLSKNWKLQKSPNIWTNAKIKYSKNHNLSSKIWIRTSFTMRKSMMSIIIYKKITKKPYHLAKPNHSLAAQENQGQICLIATNWSWVLTFIGRKNLKHHPLCLNRHVYYRICLTI